MQNGTGLKGHYSSTNSAIIIPKPDSPNIYYIFTIDSHAGTNGIQFSEVDMSLDSGMGGVTSSKNNLLFAPTTEQVTAIKNPLFNSYWVVSHKWLTNEFIAYEVTSSGVNTTPVISTLGGTPGGIFSGVMKISPNGKKIAISNAANSRLALCDFNPVTGQVSNYMNLQISAYGLEFSPNSKLLYVSDNYDGRALYQFNLESNNETEIYNSRLLISDGVTDNDFGSMQLGTDGKIYVARYDKGYLDVIDEPNLLGLNCNYQLEAVYLDGKISKLGLPPFIQSFFNSYSISFENICFGSDTMFELSDTVDAVTWDFGDPASGVDNTSQDLQPTHVFSSPGVYEVKVTYTADLAVSKDTTSVTIYDQQITMLPSSFLNDIAVVDNSDNNTITIDITNLEPGDYEFTLNEEFSNYQDEPYFENIKAGIYTLYIREKNSCRVGSIQISVIGYPKYFTPNGDGVNDYWRIEGINEQFQTNSDIFIYDRYGKLLKQLNPTSKGWDGTFNGRMLPTDDYWFSVFLEDGRQFKGHFTLKR
ncbi:T9SS type B sorting domain-containing protein [Flavobacteriaceae bacterium XHP0103]|nr:T9SS type B sorting domain-containing protein [Marixanthotalea marina]